MNSAKHKNARRFRHGSLAVVMSALLLAAVILVNVIFTALAYKFNLYTDMTDTLLFTLSDAFKNALADINTPVNIHFCAEPDYLQANEKTNYVYQTALQIAEAFDWVKVDAIDANKEPTLFAKYATNSASGQVSTTSVIVESANGTSQPRILGVNTFYVANEDGSIWAYNAEEKFAAAILSVTATDLPIAYFTTRHGETKSEYLEEIVENAGYEVRYIDLSREELDSSARLIVINNPIYDFQPANEEEETASELEKIDRFLASEYGSLMVFLDPLKLNGITNLREYLSEWGIVVSDTVVQDKMNSISSNGYSVVGTYNYEDVLGASLVKDIANTDHPPKTIFEYAAPITYSDFYSPVLDSEDGTTTFPTGSYAYYGNNASRDVSAVLRSSADALAVKDGNVVDSKGNYNLMVVSRESRIISNETYNSYVLCTATADFTADKYINSNVYANKDILYSAFKLMGREFIPADITFKVLESYDIEDMTTAQANRWTFVLVTVLPSVCLIACAVVCIRRKYR
ncbi:MAG: Gldg family protein [Eubacteriales bacterium]|nr:Gldg family protein [Eubacteriales bacterium]